MRGAQIRVFPPSKHRSGGKGRSVRSARAASQLLFLGTFTWGPLLTSSTAFAALGHQPASPLAADATDQPQTVTPPQLLQRTDAIYPEDALSQRISSQVRLRITVGVDGAVSDIEVVQSGGSAFDEAASDALAKWRFIPAMRGDLALASKIDIPFDFYPPEIEADVVKPDAAKMTEARELPEPATDSEAETQEQAAIDITVVGDREERTQSRSVGDFSVEHDVLAAAPRQEGAEILRAAPGVYVGRGEGPAVAHNYMLRGFDAEHGQDIEFRVGGLPINLPSHIHGQGYADLSFLIADAVSSMRVSEGVHDPRQGDFAVAGSINLSLGVQAKDRGARVRSSYGSFGTYRQLAMWAPKEANEETFGAVQYMRTDGFGENRAGQSASGMFQQRFGEGPLTFRAIGILHAARSDLAGVVRRDDVDADRVCFHCVYPQATAQAQNALSTRFLFGLFSDYQEASGANGQFGAWMSYDNFRVQENFTGYISQSQTLTRVAGRGDLIEQQNRTFSGGLTGRYRTAPYRPTTWAHGTFELGADFRFDSIDQNQNLLDATVRNQTWDTRVDAAIRSADLGGYADLDWALGKRIHARVGGRGDVLSYDVQDRLGNFVPSVRPQDAFIVGFRRSAQGLAAGPRTSVEVKALPWMSFLAAYGAGYRSPQARMLEDGEKAPFSKVRSADLGMRLDFGAPLSLSLGGYYTKLSDDVAFDASEGRLNRIGATQRLGAVINAVSRPLDWLVTSVSFTFVDATLLEAPPASAEEPQPPFAKGQNLPFVPPIVVRADAGAKHVLLHDLGKHDLDWRAGTGVSFLSSRPLPYGEFAQPVTLVDLSAGLDYGAWTLGLEVFNAINANYAAVEYSFASDWNPTDGVRPRTPARHISAGSPRAWMLSLGASL